MPDTLHPARGAASYDHAAVDLDNEPDAGGGPLKRRTLALESEEFEPYLDEIKRSGRVKTDTAAIKESIRFKARFAGRSSEEIEVALDLLDEAKRQAQAGCSLVFENENDPRARITKYAIPKSHLSLIR